MTWGAVGVSCRLGPSFRQAGLPGHICPPGADVRGQLCSNPQQVALPSEPCSPGCEMAMLTPDTTLPGLLSGWPTCRHPTNILSKWGRDTPGEEHGRGHGYGPRTQTKPRLPLTPRLTTSRHLENPSPTCPRAHGPPSVPPPWGSPSHSGPAQQPGDRPRSSSCRGSQLAPRGQAGGSHSRDCTAPAGDPKVRVTRPPGDCTRGAKGLSHLHREVHRSVRDPHDQILCLHPYRHIHIHACATQTTRTHAAFTNTCTRHNTHMHPSQPMHVHEVYAHRAHDLLMRICKHMHTVTRMHLHTSASQHGCINARITTGAPHTC